MPTAATSNAHHTSSGKSSLKFASVVLRGSNCVNNDIVFSTHNNLATPLYQQCGGGYRLAMQCRTVCPRTKFSQTDSFLEVWRPALLNPATPLEFHGAAVALADTEVMLYLKVHATRIHSCWVLKQMAL